MKLNLSNKTKGIIGILIACFCFSMVSIFSRLAGDLPTFQKAVFRNFVALIVMSIAIKQKGQKLKIKKEYLGDLIIRSTFGTMGLLCNFYAVDHLLLSDANMLNKLSPFTTVIFCYFILKEKGSFFDWAMVIVAFLGALLVIKPGFNMDLFPGFIGLLGGIAAGGAYTYIRKLGIRGVPSETIILFFSIYTTVVLLPFVLLSYQPMSLKQLAMLILVGVFGASGQYAVTKAYSYAPPKEVSVFDYSQIIFAAFWGWLLFNQHLDFYSILGYIVIISAGVAKFVKGRNT